MTGGMLALAWFAFTFESMAARYDAFDAAVDIFVDGSSDLGALLSAADVHGHPARRGWSLRRLVAAVTALLVTFTCSAFWPCEPFSVLNLGGYPPPPPCPHPTPVGGVAALPPPAAASAITIAHEEGCWGESRWQGMAVFRLPRAVHATGRPAWGVEAFGLGGGPHGL